MQIEALLHLLATAEVEITRYETQQKLLAEDNTLNLLHNLLHKDVCQEPSEELQAIFEQVFGNFWEQNEATTAVLQALHLIEPRLNAISAASAYVESWEKLGSRFELDFISKDLPLAAGDFWIQLFEQQRTFDAMPEKQQAVDYVLEFPYPMQDAKGLWIEIDGDLHQTEIQQQLDKQRDSYALAENWLPVWRIKTDDFNLIHRQVEPLKKLANEDYFRRLAQNYRQPLSNTEIGLDALQYVLSPVGIARIQASLVQCLFNGTLNLDSPLWRIAIFEQDVPCAFLAIEDFKILCTQLFDFEGNNRKLPNIELTLITTRRYEYAKLQRLNKVAHKYFIADFQTEKPFIMQPYDLLIDIGILQRRGWNLAGAYNIAAKCKITLRSSFRNRARQPNEKTINLALCKHILQPLAAGTFSPKLYKQLQKLIEIPEKLADLPLDAVQAEEKIANACLLAQIADKNPKLKILSACCLFVKATKAEKTEKLSYMEVAKQQLFCGFYETRYTSFTLFEADYQSITKEILQKVESQQNKTEIANTLQAIYEELEALPHIAWFGDFMQSFLVAAD
jgi:very-short-patch-repair endonuclease